MAYSTNELRERGVSEDVLAWRRWRRGMCLTQPAAMAGVSLHTIEHMELGKRRVRKATFAKLLALQARWDGRELARTCGASRTLRHDAGQG